MDSPTIEVDSLGKWYRLGTTHSGLLSERLARALRTPAALLRGHKPRSDKESSAEEGFWALRDVSFELHQGEAVGLVGRNGAGKSTLLKLLSRITPPTEGTIAVRGRVATLLEVGTGFHPELSGRENIYLNGGILGMRRREITRKFDEIVEFSGVARFLDTPVKRYSSGMYVRLAFAVAAHLEPEILLVDEVLAVGDGEFQRKCLGKMQDVASEGRTVVFVSHNLNAVQRLCSRALLIESGQLAMSGPTERVVSRYLEHVGPRQVNGTSIVAEDADRVGSGQARLRQVVMTNTEDRPITSVYVGQEFNVISTLEVFEPVDDAVFEVGICTSTGDQVITVQSIDGDRPPGRLEPGLREVTVKISVTLLPHEFVLDIGVHRITGPTVDFVRYAHRFTALNMAEDGGDHYRWSEVRGYVRPESTWSEIRPGVSPLQETQCERSSAAPTQPAHSS